MGWRVWGDEFEAGQLSNTDRSQPLKINKNILLRSIRTWVIVIDDPVFTNLTMKIYSNEVRNNLNTPVKLLHSSTSTYTKAEIITLDNGVREINFNFADIPLNGNTTYNVVLNGAGYVPTSSSSLNWMKAYPDPIYATGLTAAVNAVELIAIFPYQLHVIGGEY